MAVPAWLTSDVISKWFPFKNQTVRSSAPLGLLEELGVLSGGGVSSGGSTDAKTSEEIKKLKEAVKQLNGALDKLQTETALHIAGGEHWTQGDIQKLIDAAIKK